MKIVRCIMYVLRRYLQNEQKENTLNLIGIKVHDVKCKLKIKHLLLSQKTINPLSLL